MEVEQEAGLMGWVPKDQFRGDPATWREAADFVARGREIQPILRKNNEKLVGDVAALQAKSAALETALAAANESMAEFRKFHDATAEREYKRAMADLAVQKVQALKDGPEGAETVVVIDNAMRDLERTAPSPAPAKTPAAPAVAAPAAPQVHPDYPAWEADNRAWLAEGPKMAYAASIANYIRAMNPTLVGRPFLDKITEEVAARFDGAAPVHSRVEGGTREVGRRGNGRSYSDLPADAKAACDKMEAKLVGDNRAFKTQADWRKNYVSQYDWS